MTINNASGVSAVNIQDGGNSITVDGTVAISGGSITVSGTVAATQSGTWNVGTVATITNVVHVDDNSGSLTVDAPVGTPVFVRLSDGASAITTLPVSVASLPSGAVTNVGTFAVQESGAALTSLQLIDDPVATLGSTLYTEAASKGFIVGGVRRDADTTLVDTTNEIAPLQINSVGQLKVEVFDGGDSHTVDAPVGTPVFVRLSDGTNPIATLPVSVASLPTQAVTNVGTFAVQESGAALTSLQLIDDAVYTDGVGTFTKGFGILGQDGTNPQAIKTDSNGELQVDVLTIPAIPAGSNVIGGVTQSGTWTTTNSTLTATVTEDAASAGAEASILIAGVRNDAGSAKTSADGDFGNLALDSAGRVGVADLGGSITIDQSTASSLNAQVVGALASDAVAAGNPVLVAGYASAAAPGDVSANGDVVYAWHLRNGAQATVITAAGALVGGDATNGLDVDVTRMPGTATEDAVSTGGETLVLAGAVRRDTAASSSGTDGDYSTINTDATGRIWTHVGTVDGGTITTITNVVHVDDNSGSITIDNAALSVTGGGVEASAVRVTIASDSTGVLSVDDNGGSLTVDGTVAVSSITTSMTPGTSAAHLGKAEDAVHSSGDTGVFALAVRSDTAAATGANGDYVAFITDGNGRLWVNVGGVTSDSLGKAEDAVHSTGDTGVMALSVRSDTAASTAGTDGDYASLITDSTGRLHVNVGNTVTVTGAGGTFPVTDSGGSLTVDNGGTFAVQPAGSVAHDGAAAAINPVLTGGYGSAAAPTDVSATNDSVRAWHLLSGAYACQPTFAGILAVAGNGASGTGVQRVTIASDSTGILAGVTTVTTVTTCSTVTTLTGGGVAHDGAAAAVKPHLIGGFASAAAPSDVSADGDAVQAWHLRNGAYVSQPTYAGVLATTGNGVSGTGVQRVTLASDSTGVLATVSTVTTVSTLTGGGVASDGVDSGNPIKTGARAVATLSTATLVSAADRVDSVGDLDGATLVRTNAALGDVVSGQATNTDGASTQCIASSGAGVKTYLTDCTLANSSATAITVDIKDGATIKWTFPVPAGGGVTHSWNTPLAGSAATAWNFDGSAAATTLSCSMSGFKSKI